MSSQWRSVRYCRNQEFPNYEVNRKGEIRGKTHKTIKPQATNHRTGRPYARMWSTDRHYYRSVYVHAIVAYTWKRDPKPGEQILHMNEDKLDNRNCNLRWGTAKQNARRHFRLTGRRSTTAPRLSPRAHEIIHKLWAAGFSQVKIGNAIGVSNSCISRIVRGLSVIRGHRDVCVDWDVLGVPPFDL